MLGLLGSSTIRLTDYPTRHMLGFYLALFVLPAAIIATAFILAAIIRAKER